MVVRARKEMPSQEDLLEMLSYDADTGVLTYLFREPWFAGKHGWYPKYLDAWNRRYAGTAARTVLPKGYIGVTVLGTHYFAHRIIWKMVFGADPDHIDHINGITCDNRLINLRNVDALGNQRNRRLNSNNTSGQSGVHWCATNKKFVAKIRSSGKSKMLGRFVTVEGAIAARQAAERELNFSKNHGRK